MAYDTKAACTGANYTLLKKLAKRAEVDVHRWCHDTTEEEGDKCAMLWCLPTGHRDEDRRIAFAYAYHINQSAQLLLCRDYELLPETVPMLVFINFPGESFAATRFKWPNTPLDEKTVLTSVEIDRYTEVLRPLEATLGLPVGMLKLIAEFGPLFEHGPIRVDILGTLCPQLGSMVDSLVEGLSQARAGRTVPCPCCERNGIAYCEQGSETLHALSARIDGM
jgi:hypothetical protein